MEVHFGEFRTDVDLPCPVDEEHIEAEYNDGFLRVRLPKLQARRVDVG
jgi:HSP20 family molecular chaperone IbpA